MSDIAAATTLYAIDQTSSWYWNWITALLAERHN